MTFVLLSLVAFPSFEQAALDLFHIKSFPKVSDTIQTMSLDLLIHLMKRQPR